MDHGDELALLLQIGWLLGRYLQKVIWGIFWNLRFWYKFWRNFVVLIFCKRTSSGLVVRIPLLECFWKETSRHIPKNRANVGCFRAGGILDQIKERLPARKPGLLEIPWPPSCCLNHSSLVRHRLVQAASLKISGWVLNRWINIPKLLRSICLHRWGQH